MLWHSGTKVQELQWQPNAEEEQTLKAVVSKQWLLLAALYQNEVKDRKYDSKDVADSRAGRGVRPSSGGGAIVHRSPEYSSVCQEMAEWPAIPLPACQMSGPSCENLRLFAFPTC